MPDLASLPGLNTVYLDIEFRLWTSYRFPINPSNDSNRLGEIKDKVFRQLVCIGECGRNGWKKVRMLPLSVKLQIVAEADTEIIKQNQAKVISMLREIEERRNEVLRRVKASVDAENEAPGLKAVEGK